MNQENNVLKLGGTSMEEKHLTTEEYLELILQEMSSLCERISRIEEVVTKIGPRAKNLHNQEMVVVQDIRNDVRGLKDQFTRIRQVAENSEQEDTFSENKQQHKKKMQFGKDAYALMMSMSANTIWTNVLLRRELKNQRGIEITEQQAGSCLNTLYQANRVERVGWGQYTVLLRKGNYND